VATSCALKNRRKKRKKKGKKRKKERNEVQHGGDTGK
jgi:hypothetical protein